MTLQEFKAWFEGFTENLDGTPNKDQWKRIKARVKEIDGVTVTERVFVDRYWSHYGYVPYPIAPVHWPTTICSAGTIGAAPTSSDFNATTAMYSLGSVEAQQLVS